MVFKNNWAWRGLTAVFSGGFKPLFSIIGNSIRVTHELIAMVSGGLKPIFSTKQEQSQEQ